MAVRMPSDEIAGELIRQGGGYIAAPSANVSGRPSPTTAEHVYEDMKGRIPLILDGGPVPIGLESTIVDLTEDCPVILRPGYITLSMIQEVIRETKVDRGLIQEDSFIRPKAPGMKYRHYAPRAQLTIVEGEAGPVIAYINEQARGTGKASAPGRTSGPSPAICFRSCGSLTGTTWTGSIRSLSTLQVWGRRS